MADDDSNDAFDYMGQIKAAIRFAKGVNVYDDPAATFRPPAALVFAPELDLAVGADATEATYPVIVMASGDKDVLKRLLKLVSQVAQAIHENTDNSVIVRSASPGNYEAGGQALPCYLLTVEVSL
ncbi:hypothetical protein ACIRG5_42340 [Lentzea sp. NPDC102401]|uniref:hypothetical protein n=1 Tax=Lentzea sp. NPDC102401 TaxID=3364128 RepID=UPI00380561BE